ncbi:MAG: 3-oxoacyl-[acyl-carrier-protein] synthase III C-terminal domain-containing protein [Kiritimatiellia bacterium]|nr:3-oxoacyl-[acyl-carrier-protein] synthase III C-terminal domain-containing protein [Kiritimatiellia bacterium]
MTPILRALATANPPFYATQKEAYEFYASHFKLAPEEDELYRRLLLEGPIHGRFFGLDKRDDACETDPDLLNARFLKYARLIATAAAHKALEEANLSAKSLGGLVVNTCTGYLCPGLTSYVAEDLGLEGDLRTLDLAGMGCGGALPNLQATAGLLALDETRPILSLAVEICSATLFMGPDPALIVSNSIFGDGAAAAILQAREPEDNKSLLRIVDFASGLYPKYRKQLHYRQEGGRLRNVLSVKVPLIGAKTDREVLNRLLARHNLNQKDISWWAVHAGGTAVLDQVGRDLGLDKEDLRFSLEVFHTYGNMSSPSVLFALRRILDQGHPRSGERGILLSFGAGFSAFAALVEFL